MAENSSSSGFIGTKKYLFPFILVVSLFFLWGMANNLNDILIKQFEKAFDLTRLQAGLVQSAFYFGYFLLALPAASLIKKYSYKIGILIGLCLYGLGALLFYPAAEIQVYGFFLFALFVIASGLAFLETSANPYVTELGPEETSENRLNLAQSFNPLGSIAGVLVGRFFIFTGVQHTDQEIAAMTEKARAAYYAAEAHAVQIPYLIIAIVILVVAVLVYFTKFPEVRQAKSAAGHKVDMLKSLGRLIKVKHFRTGVLAQFLYVGAQVGVWSFLIYYIQYAVPGTSAKDAADYLIFSLVGFMIGRFIATWLLKYLQATRLMGIYAIINSLLLTFAIIGDGLVAVWALVLVSFFMSMMFPTIFALSVKKLGDDKPFGSSLVIMAIIGGAILPALMGWVSDFSNIQWAYVLPLVCFVYVIYYSFGGYRVSEDHTPTLLQEA